MTAGPRCFLREKRASHLSLPTKPVGVRQLILHHAARGFLPSAGRILRMEWPSLSPKGTSVRVDTGIGMKVGTAYDSLIAKIIVHAENRATAIATLRNAIGSTVYLGIYTNQTLLREIVDQNFFQSGSTFIDTIDTWDIGQRPIPDDLPEVAATALSGSPSPVPVPIGALDNWRLG